jgi:signal transduction histidine kinase
VITLVTTGTLNTQGFPDRIHGAMLCLMINALDVMPQGGRLDLILTPDVRSVRIELRDTGPGVPSDAVDAIWSPGYTTKTERPGLGLHVARSIIEAHGGTIRCESKPEGGGCFVIQLPSTSHH